MKNEATDRIQEEFMSLLRIPAPRNPAEVQKRERQLQSRIIGLGFAVYCGRCGGCGSYSWCQAWGTTCFGCAGTGYVAQELTAKLYKQLQAVVADGTLDRYLADLRVKNTAIQAAKSASKRVMDAWSTCGVSQAYNWTKACSGPRFDAVDAAIAHELNEPMYKLFESISKLSDELDSIGRSAVATVQEREQKEAAIAEKRPALVAAAEAAIAEINRLAALLPEYTARREKGE